MTTARSNHVLLRGALALVSACAVQTSAPSPRSDAGLVEDGGRSKPDGGEGLRPDASVDRDGGTPVDGGDEDAGRFFDGGGAVDGGVADGGRAWQGGGFWCRDRCPSTTVVRVCINLDSRLPHAPGGTPWDPANPWQTGNLGIHMFVCDTNGVEHAARVYFRRVGTLDYDWWGQGNAAELSPPPPTGFSANGIVTFTSGGALHQDRIRGSTWDFRDAEPAQSIIFDFGQSITEGGDGLTGSTTSFPSNVKLYDCCPAGLGGSIECPRGTVLVDRECIPVDGGTRDAG